MAQRMTKERRSYPRFPVDFTVKVRLPALPDEEPGETFDGTATNVSRTSIQFTCEDKLIAALLRQPELPYTCRLDFKLPWNEHPFSVGAQVLTHRRISQFQYVLVLLLRHEDAAQEELLDRLLGQQQAVGLD